MITFRSTAVLPLCLALSFVACHRVPSGPRHLEAGKKLMIGKDYGRAILEFRNATAAMPKDAEAFYQLGLAYEATGKAEFFQLAFDSLRRAAQLNPKHTAARLEMAKLEALTRDPAVLQDAETNLKKLLAEAEGGSETLNLLAMTEFKLGKKEQASENLIQSLAQAPGDVQAAALLANVKLSQNDGKGAEEVMRKALASSPKSPDVMIMLAGVYQVEQKLPEALAQLQGALEIYPKNIRALVLLAQIQVAMNRMEEAESTYQRITSLGDKETKHLHALFLFSQGKKDASIRELEQLQKDDASDRAARTRLITAYYLAGRKADARKVVENALRKNRKDADALLQLGELLASEGKFGEAEANLNQVLQMRSDSAEAHYILAKVNQARGEELRYRQELFEALKIRPQALAVRLETAQALLAAKDPKAAIHVLDEAVASQRSRPALLVQRNWALWALGDFAEMRKGIDLGLSQQRSADLLIQDGYWKVQKGDFSGAVGALEGALKLSPDSVLAMEGLRQTRIAQKKGPAGLTEVKAYAARLPKSAAVQQYLGKVLLDAGDRAEARAAFTAAKAADPNVTAIDLFLVQLDISERKLDDAASRLRMVVSSDPRNSLAYLWLGNLEESKGDHRAATANYRKAVDLNPNNASALNNLAYSMSEYENNPEGALKLAQQAKQMAPDQPVYADTLGWILYRKGVYDSAVHELESAVAHDQGSGTYQYHLAMAYFKAGKKERAKATLETALKHNPSLPEAKPAQELIAKAQ